MKPLYNSSGITTLVSSQTHRQGNVQTHKLLLPKVPYGTTPRILSHDKGQQKMQLGKVREDKDLQQCAIQIAKWNPLA